jgi:anaerobic ribonucleoside-triphosphate reductase activating protein
MLRLVNYNIVFQEVPNEVTLAINISNCPNRCAGCHSPYLQENIGEELTENILSDLMEKYSGAITCICFMGGDADPKSVEKLAVFVKEKTGGGIKTGWYSGKNTLPVDCSFLNFNYIKLGAYIEKLGGLNSKITNQRFFHIEDGIMKDITYKFRR